MKVYIAGKITGLDLNTAFRNFQTAQIALISLGHNRASIQCSK